MWDVFDEIGYVGSIEEGVTTKEQVIQALGEPDSENKAENTIKYHGTGSTGALCIGGGYQASCGLIKEEWRWITIYLYDKDVVSGVASSNEPAKPRILRIRKREQMVAKIRERGRV